jgi:hypothetical protein
MRWVNKVCMWVTDRAHWLSMTLTYMSVSLRVVRRAKGMRFTPSRLLWTGPYLRELRCWSGGSLQGLVGR